MQTKSIYTNTSFISLIYSEQGKYIDKAKMAQIKSLSHMIAPKAQTFTEKPVLRALNYTES